MSAFKVDVIVLCNVPRELGDSAKVVVGVPKRRLWESVRYLGAAALRPWSFRHKYRDWKRRLDFPFLHKQVLAEHMDEYDLFIYSEDDMLLTERNLRAFVEMSEVLPENEIAAFLRYEQGPNGTFNYPEMHGIFHWEPESVRRRGSYTLARFTCDHAACYVLTRKQLRRAISSGGYLVPPHNEKYDFLCTAASDPYTQCGFEPLICISHLDDFLIHHLPNRYVGTSFGVDDRELRRQVGALLKIGNNGHRPKPLFPATTKMESWVYSKNMYEPARHEILSAVPAATETVLSFGCGWGATEAELIRSGKRVTAIPVDPIIPGGAIQAGVEIIPGNIAEALQQLADRRFDVLLLSNVLHLLDKPVEVLSELTRLVKQDGTVIVLVPNVRRIATLWRKCLRDEGYKDLGNFTKTGVNEVSVNRLTAWLKTAGAQVLKMGYLAPENSRGVVAGLPDKWTSLELIAIARVT